MPDNGARICSNCGARLGDGDPACSSCGLHRSLALAAHAALALAAAAWLGSGGWCAVNRPPRIDVNGVLYRTDAAGEAMADVGLLSLLPAALLLMWALRRWRRRV